MLSAYCHLEKDNAEVIPASDKKQTSSKAPGRSEESNASEMNELQGLSANPSKFSHWNKIWWVVCRQYAAPDKVS